MRTGETKRDRREKGKSVEKGRGKYRERVGRSLTKDGVKMEGEKCGKGQAPCYPTLSLSFPFPFGRSDGNTPTETPLEDFEISQVASPGSCGNFLRHHFH